MSQAGAIRAGRAYVELYGEDASLANTLTTDETAVKSWGQRVSQISATVGTAFGAGVQSIGSMGAAVTAGVAGLLGYVTGAGTAAKNTDLMSTHVGEVASALNRLTPIGTRTFDALSSGIFRGGTALTQFSNLLQTSGPTGLAASDAIDRVTASTERLFMVHRSSPLGNAALKGGLLSRLIGDQDGQAFYRQLGRIANGARLADAFQQGPIRGLREALDIGVKRGLSIIVGSSARGLNALSGGLISLVGRTFGAVSHAAAGGSLFDAIGETANGNVPKVSLFARAIGGVGSAASLAWRTGKAGLDGIRAGLDAIGSKGTIAVGVAAGLVGTLSAAAGIDLRSITSRVMSVQSFAAGASDLHKQKGSGISAADVSTAKALTAAMDRLAGSAQVMWAQIGAAVAPAVTRSLDGVSRLVQGGAKWLQANRPLVASIFDVARRIFTVATATTVASKTISAILGPIQALFGGWTGLAVALAAGVAIWAAWSGAGQQAIDWLRERFGALFKDFNTAWTGIINAVGTGRLELAAKIAFVGVKLAFMDMVKGLGGSWTDFQKLWFKSIYLVGDVWDRVFAGIRKGWLGAQNFLSKGIAYLLGLLEGKTEAELKQVQTILEEDGKKEQSKADAELEASLKKRQAELEAQLAKLPGSDDAEINRLRAQLEALAAQAKVGADDPLSSFGLKKLDAGVHTQGTFNAAAVRGVGGGPLNEIAAATKETAKNTKRLANKGASGLTFTGGSGVGF